jgi:hypothetical protein
VALTTEIGRCDDRRGTMDMVAVPEHIMILPSHIISRARQRAGDKWKVHDEEEEMRKEREAMAKGVGFMFMMPP